MSLWNTRSYAVSGLDLAVTDLIYTFVTSMINRFPIHTFDSDAVYIDTKNIIKDYKRDDEGLERPKTIHYPKLTVTTDGMSDPASEDNKGPLLNQLDTFPGITSDRRLKSPHALNILSDKKIGILLDSIDLRRKVELIFRFETGSKADLTTLKSYIYNTLPLGVNSKLYNYNLSLIMPNMLMNDIMKLSFDVENFDINNEDHMNDFLTYINGSSNVDFELKTRVDNDDIDNHWFVMNRYINYLYRFEKIDGESGSSADQNGKVYDKFEFELHCTLDFKTPNTYRLNYRAFNIINKCYIDGVYFDSVGKDRYIANHVTYSEPVYIEDRNSILTVPDEYELIIREEFMVEDESDTIRLSQFISQDSKYRPLLIWLTPEEREDLFLIHFYEDGNPFLPDDVVITGDDVSFPISNCNTESLYSLFLYLNMNKLSKVINKMLVRKENDDYPNVDNLGNPLVVGGDEDAGKDIPYNEVEGGIIRGRITGRPTNSNVLETQNSFNSGGHMKGFDGHTENLIRGFRGYIHGRRQ